MAYSELLADRVRTALGIRSEITEKKMFGGIAFMKSGHMCVGIIGDTLMARVGPDRYDDALSRPHAREMDFTGRTMKGYVYVDEEGLRTESALMDWIGLCEAFVGTLPPK